MKLNNRLQLVFESQAPGSHFFGYYCHNPLSPDGGKLLAHKTDFDGRELRAGDCAEVGYFTLPDGNWHRLDKTEAFNWQDGAMLQWVPGTNGTQVVYNVLSSEGEAKAVLRNLVTGNSHELEKPIYSVHPSGKFAVGQNFSRISCCRPSYGYREHPQFLDRWRGDLPPDDGYFRIDLETGRATPWVRTHEIVEQLQQAVKGKHYLHHFWWNPSGTRGLFYHRVLCENGKFSSNLVSVDKDGSNVFIFPEALQWSHLAWRNDDEFVVWMRPEIDPNRNVFMSGLLRFFQRAGLKVVRSFAPVCFQPVLKHFVSRHGYYLFHDQSRKCRMIGRGQLLVDGHPSFIGRGEYFISDTYQDATNRRHLFMYNLKNRVKRDLGSFFSPFNNCGYRCDLHPRLSDDGRNIIIDSAHSGRRQVYVFSSLETY